MFEPRLSQYEWGPQLIDAARHGVQEAEAFARKLRRRLTDEEADTVGVVLAELLALRIDPPGRIAGLVAAAAPLAGPRTIELTGRILREQEGAVWRAEQGLALLTTHRRVEAAIQLLLCSRESADLHVVQRAADAYRGFPRALAELLNAGEADVERQALEAYLAYELERAMVLGTRYPREELQRGVASTARDVLGRVVWAAYHGARPTVTFVVDPDGTGFLDHRYEHVEVPDGNKVGVVHAVELTADERVVWGEPLADLEIVSPFSQLDRECTVGGEFRSRNVDEFADHWDLVRWLYPRGWTRDAESREFQLPLRHAALVLDTRLQPSGDRRWLERLSLRTFGGLATLGHDVVVSEATRATLELLEQFAPDRLYE